jgi:uncharacterized membrane protein
MLKSLVSILLIVVLLMGMVDLVIHIDSSVEYSDVVAIFNESGSEEVQEEVSEYKLIKIFLTNKLINQQINQLTNQGIEVIDTS